MELRIGDRYQLTYAIQTLADGVLYAGKELSLSRDVLIYILNKEGNQNTEDLQGALGQISNLNNKSFFHVLNAGVIDGHVYVVFTSYTGKPLMQSIQYHMLSSREILSLVYELAMSVSNAREDNLFGFPVTAENLWLTNENQLKIINFWTPSETNQTNAMGLCLLMYQLITKSCVIPKTEEAILYPFMHDFENLSVKQRELLSSLVSRIFRGDHSLLTLIFSLREIIEIPEPAKPVTSPLIQEPIIRHEPKSKVESFRREPIKELDIDDDLDEEEEEEYEDQPTGRSWGNKLKWVAGICVAGIVFIGIVFLTLSFLTSSNPDKQGQLSKVDSTPQTQPTTAPTESSTPTTKPAVTENPQESLTPDEGFGDIIVTDQEVIEVPNLIGLKQKAAEKKALENGLHYNFVYENSKGPNGKVIKQEPEAGTSVAKGDTITFTVNRNKE